MSKKENKKAKTIEDSEKRHFKTKIGGGKT